MSILLDDALSQYLNVNGSSVTGAPLTLHTVVRTNDATISQTLLTLSDGTNTNRFQMNYQGNVANDPILMAVNGTTFQTTNGPSVDTWFSSTYTSSAVNARALFWDGANKATNTTSITPADITNFKVGSVGGIGGYFSGNIALAAIWNVALSDAEVASLTVTAGSVYKDPRLVQPASLKHLWINWKNSGYIDLIGNLHLTAVNSPTSDTDMPVVIGANGQNIYGGLF